MAVISEQWALPVGRPGQKGDQQLASPGLLLAKVSTTKLSLAHLQVTLQVGCALFPFSKILSVSYS